MITTATADEQALLAAIQACPEDDTPRLVYADWLDEHDITDLECRSCGGNGFERDPPNDHDYNATSCANCHQASGPYGHYNGRTGEFDCPKCLACGGRGRRSNGLGAYAEFIRVQCELKRIGVIPGDQVWNATLNGEFQRYTYLRERERELMKTNRLLWWSSELNADVWLTATGWEPGNSLVHSVVCRGMPYRWFGTLDRWNQQGPRTVRQPRTCYTEVRIVDRRPNNPRDGSRCSWFGTDHLQSIQMQQYCLPMRLFSRLDLTRIKSLQGSVTNPPGAFYATEADAHDALSVAALAWAREESKK